MPGPNVACSACAPNAPSPTARNAKIAPYPKNSLSMIDAIIRGSRSRSATDDTIGAVNFPIHCAQIGGIMPTIDPNQNARARLVAAGFSDEDIAVLLERATQLVEGLERLAALDAELPE